MLERTQEGVFSKLVFSKLSPVVQMSKLAYKFWCPFHFSWVFAMSMSQRQRNILLLVPIMFLMQMKFLVWNGTPKTNQCQTQGVILALSFSCSTLNHMNTVFIIHGHRTTSYPFHCQCCSERTVSQVNGRVSQLASLHLFLITTPVSSLFDSPSDPLKMQLLSFLYSSSSFLAPSQVTQKITESPQDPWQPVPKPTSLSSPLRVISLY